MLGNEVAAHIMGIPLQLENVVVEVVGSKTAVVCVSVEDPVEETSVALPERHTQVDPQLEQVGGPVGRPAQILKEWRGPFKVGGGKLESARPEVKTDIKCVVVS